MFVTLQRPSVLNRPPAVLRRSAARRANGAALNHRIASQSSHDSRRITDMINLLGDRFAIVCGVDDLLLENALFGAVGWVSGLANTFPREAVQLFKLAKAGTHRRGAGALPLVHAAAASRCGDQAGAVHQARQPDDRRGQRMGPRAAPDARSARSASGSQASSSTRHRYAPEAASSPPERSHTWTPTSSSSAPASSASLQRYQAAARPAVACVLIDRKGIAEETSRGNAGAFAFSDIMPLATQDVLAQAAALARAIRSGRSPSARISAADHAVAAALLARRLARPRRRRHQGAERADAAGAHARWRRWSQAPGSAHMVRSDGVLELYESEAELARAPPELERQSRARASSSAHVRGDELRELQPGLVAALRRRHVHPEMADGHRSLRLRARGRQGRAAARRDLPQGRGAGSCGRSSDGVDRRASPTARAITRQARSSSPAAPGRRPLTAPLGDHIPLDTERGYNTTLPPATASTSSASWSSAATASS